MVRLLLARLLLARLLLARLLLACLLLARLLLDCLLLGCLLLGRLLLGGEAPRSARRLPSSVRMTLRKGYLGPGLSNALPLTRILRLPIVSRKQSSTRWLPVH